MNDSIHTTGKVFPEKKNLFELIFEEGGFGLEEECQRVDKEGRLSASGHPFDDPKLDRDFCESQLEIITGVSRSPGEAVKEVTELKKAACRTLFSLENGPEYLWPFSNPPVILREEDIHIADFHGKKAGRTLYRKHLAERYGRRKQALCGIHFNFSLPEKITDSFRERGGNPDDLYMRIAASMAGLSWLIVALTAASPVYDASCTDRGVPGETVSGKYSSLRCSPDGYWNFFTPEISFDDIDSYIDSISRYVESGKLYSSSELYYPVRLKPAGTNSLEGLRHGINHIELRMIDINPLLFSGIDVRDLNFITALVSCITGEVLEASLSYQESKENSTGEGLIRNSDIYFKAAADNMKAAAGFPLEDIELHAGKEKVRLVDAAFTVLEYVKRYALRHGAGKYILDSVDFQEEKIRNPEKRYADIVMKRFENDFQRGGLSLAEKYSETVI